MKNYLRRVETLFVLWVVLSTCVSTTFAAASGDTIRAVPVKDSLILNSLIKETKRAVHIDSEIEEEQIVNVIYQSDSIYVVPVRTNVGDNRGCYIYSFDKKFKMSQKIILSDLEEAELCETFIAVFSCNTAQKRTSGIGILYGKRFGSDHYWFEGSYLSLDDAGTLSDDKKLSRRLNDIDTVSKAKKKLGCR